jgi:hypothetical protein
LNLTAKTAKRSKNNNRTAKQSRQGLQEKQNQSTNRSTRRENQMPIRERGRGFTKRGGLGFYFYFVFDFLGVLGGLGGSIF